VAVSRTEGEHYDTVNPLCAAASDRASSVDRRLRPTRQPLSSAAMRSTSSSGMLPTHPVIGVPSPSIITTVGCDVTPIVCHE
jgi:hypothetical protein